MALPKSLDNLKKEGSKEDKVTVASGVAVSVVVILFVAWGIYFFHKIQSGSQQLQVGGVQDQFNFTNVQQAQQQLQHDLSNTNSTDLQSAYQQSDSGPVQMQNTTMQVGGQGGTDQFGNAASH